MARTYLTADLAIFDLLQMPVWVVDLDRAATWWANLASVALWQASDRAQMIDRSANNPALAQAVVDGGLELSGLACFQSVADALRSVDR